MQLTFKVLLGILLSLTALLAQESKPIEIDFLLNYYEQEGNNSAVTGGKGTEELTNVGTKIVINIPATEDKSFNLSYNADSYTSASSDNIDPLRSGASGHDLHTSGSLGYMVELPESNAAYSLTTGFSSEYDYASFSFGGGWTFYSQDKNQQLSINAMNFFDVISLIYPRELRRQGKLLSDDRRQTFSLQLNYSQVINKKLQMSFMTDFVYQNGLLSTSFNRVYFKDSNRVDVERLPGVRFKYPVGIWANYFITDKLVARLKYRYYYDTFGVSANTVSLETVVRFDQTWALIPFIRYHKQNKADYFNSFQNNRTQDEFYTSDNDLSSFNSMKIGLGLRYYPIGGIFDVYNLLQLKRLDLRAGFYDRSDGLSAFNITAGISFIIP